MADNGNILVDAGPLVAFLVKTDVHHRWAVAKFRVMPGPWYSCEPVLTEAFFLVAKVPGGSDRFFQLLDSGLIRIEFDVMEHRAALRRLMQKYANLPMSLADASLVRMVEINQNATVFTVDSDFQIYRAHGRSPIRLVTPTSNQR